MIFTVHTSYSANYASRSITSVQLDIGFRLIVVNLIRLRTYTTDETRKLRSQMKTVEED